MTRQRRNLLPKRNDYQTWLLNPLGLEGLDKVCSRWIQYKKKQKIIQYTGTIKTQAEYDDNPSGYGIAIPEGKVIDADSPQSSSIARYANDCLVADIEAGYCSGINSRYYAVTRGSETSVWIKATRYIPANSEIFVCYGGDDYCGTNS